MQFSMNKLEVVSATLMRPFVNSLRGKPELGLPDLLLAALRYVTLRYNTLRYFSLFFAIFRYTVKNGTWIITVST